MSRFAWVVSLFWWVYGSVNVFAERPIDFNRDIRPILSDRCFRCHGPDSKTREAGLRLDLRDEAIKSLDSDHQAIVPGDLEASELWQRVTTDDEESRMPPVAMGPPLTDNARRLLERWIQEGAPYAEHWSLQPIRRPDLSNLPAGRTGLDRLVNQELVVRGISPNGMAPRAILARRLSLAIVGLPPSAAEVASFLSDTRPDADRRYIDQLLASPRYGERWGAIWLDMARYADSAGYAQDPERTIWRYRDWVIDAYNSNMPFDEFTITQLAGDLLESPTNAQQIATAFHRNTMTNSEGGTDDEEFRNAAIIDRVNTTAQIWLGLTFACAQCHDHKYDRISQAEYFRFFAILNNTEDADRGDESPWIEELSPEQKASRREIESKLAALAATGTNNGQQVGEAKPTDTPQKAEVSPEEQLRKELNQIVGVRTPILRELPVDKRRETFIHVRGNFRVRGETVEPGVPSLLPPMFGEPNRLNLARWLASDQNPLTARVLVNRYWEHLFGRGLVATSEDFGAQGDLPTHPELLDYLAFELIRHDWDVKWLLREILSSETFQRDSQVRPDLASADLENRWLARGPRFRLSAETIRDQALSLSGLLSTKLYGPSVKPYQPKLGIASAFGGSTDWDPSQGEDRFRRGLYTSWRRTTPYPSMTTFDAPSREFCTIRRIRTNTPLQALVTLNDPVYVEAAQAWGRRVVREGGPDVNSKIRFAVQSVLVREPLPEEVQRLTQLYHDVYSRFKQDHASAVSMSSDPLGPLPTEGQAAELATWTVLGNVLLNLDETLAVP